MPYYDRKAKLVPWYHANKPRCDTETIFTEIRCVNSAIWRTKDKNSKNLCGIHAKMTDLPLEPIPVQTVSLLRDKG